MDWDALQTFVQNNALELIIFIGVWMIARKLDDLESEIAIISSGVDSINVIVDDDLKVKDDYL